MKNNVSTYIATLIKKMPELFLSSEKIGLLEGKIGITLLLYYYSRHYRKTSIKRLADQYLEEVINKITTDTIHEITCVAWGIYHLIEYKYIDAEDDVFDDLDLIIFEQEKVIQFSQFQQNAYLGLYIKHRISRSNPETMMTWMHRAENYLKMIHNILFSRYMNFKFPIISCSDLCLILSFCIYVQDNIYFKKKIELIYEEISQFINIAFLDEKNTSNKYLLSLLLGNTLLGLNQSNDVFWGESVTIEEVIQFYINRFILGIDIQTPEPLLAKVSSLLNEKAITAVLNTSASNNIGLSNNVVGLAWALIQWDMNSKKI